MLYGWALISRVQVFRLYPAPRLWVEYTPMPGMSREKVSMVLPILMNRFLEASRMSALPPSM